MNIMILVNKNFEYAGYRSGVEYQVTAGKTPHLKMKRETGGIYGFNEPSCVYELESDTQTHSIREYCINYLFPEGKSSSNSQNKCALLTTLLKMCIDDEWTPDWIISVSTSESCPEVQNLKGNTSVNGCVFMGSQFFAKDCREYDKDPVELSPLTIAEPFMGSGSIIDEKKFSDFILMNQSQIIDGMHSVKNAPAENLFCDANPNNISLGVINITNYNNYKEADPATHDEFKKFVGSSLIPEGLETTHAVVEMATQIIGTKYHKKMPVLFVSPIVDRYRQFDFDVDGNWGEQNRLGSYNAGVVVANMLELIRNDLPITND